MGQGSSTHFDYDAQLLSDKVVRSVAVEGEFKGETAPRRNPDAKDGLKSVPFPEEDGGRKTIWECFQRGVEKYPENNSFGTRRYTYEENKSNGKTVEKRAEYVWLTFKEADTEIRELASGLVALGAKSGDNMGIFANNRAEWMCSSLAFYSQGLRTVSLYATLGPEAVEYIINHASTPIVIVSKENVKALLAVLPKIKDTVKHIVQIDSREQYGNTSETVSEADVKTASEHGVQLLGYSEVRKMGQEKPVEPSPAGAKDLAFIMYTSGTTGNPKGVLLSHENIVAAAACVPSVVDLQPTDVLLSYLPLAHIFETVVEVALMVYGASIGYFQGNVKMLTDDIGALRPSVLPGVPRVFSRIYQKVFEGVNSRSFFVRWFFNRAYNYQANQLRNKLPRDPSYDAKVFIPLRTKLGLDRMKLIITGAAPCAPYLIEFLRIVIGGNVVQGYGMTETSAAISIQQHDDSNLGHCGPPFVCNEVKLVDVPDMNYLSTDSPCPRGEIWVRGPNCFLGYYKDEESTRSTLIDGWVATGDIGRWNPNGTLSVIDRKKNMFKLSQGEYIAAEKVETEYQKSPLVGQIWIYGNSFKSTLLAVVVPAAEPLSKLLKEKGWWVGAEEHAPGTQEFADDFHKSVTAAAHAEDIKKLIWASLKEHEKGLKGFEKVVDILVESRIDKMLAGFTEANNCLTPTFKLRRNNLVKRYVKELKALYAKNGEAPQPDEKWPGEE